MNVDPGLAGYLAEAEPLSLATLQEGSAGKIKVYPPQLNAQLNGGVRLGHTALVFGRPGACKTLLAINIAAGFLAQGMRVLYIGNEEPKRELAMRWLSLLGKQKLHDLDSADAEHSKAAIEKAYAAAAERLPLLSVVTGISSLPTVENLARHLQPKVIVLDQLRHMHTGNEGEGRTQAMEEAQRQFRAMADSLGFFGITISQAGGFAEGKLILDMGDLDSSKTGTQGAVDLILGVGVNETYKAQGMRMLSICRNKVSGKHCFFPVRVDEQHTRIDPVAVTPG